MITNRQHRLFNTWLSMVLLILLMTTTMKTNTKIEQCETILYEKLTGQKDPLRSK